MLVANIVVLTIYGLTMRQKPFEYDPFSKGYTQPIVTTKTSKWGSSNDIEERYQF